MNGLDRAKVKEDAIDMAYSARTVIDQLARKANTRESLEASRILQDALTKAIPDAGNDTEAAAVLSA